MAQTHYKHRFSPSTPKLLLWGLVVIPLLSWTASTHAEASQPMSTLENLAETTITLGNASNQSSNPYQDSILMDSVQKQTIKYFWDFAHPTSGLARERSNIAYDYGSEVVTTGGSGMGFMALIVGVERG